METWGDVMAALWDISQFLADNTASEERMAQGEFGPDPEASERLSRLMVRITVLAGKDAANKTGARAGGG